MPHPALPQQDMTATARRRVRAVEAVGKSPTQHADPGRSRDVSYAALPRRAAPASSFTEALAEAGFAKMNFAGGEPVLCPWLPRLVHRTKGIGFSTSVVTNGSLITEPGGTRSPAALTG